MSKPTASSPSGSGGLSDLQKSSMGNRDRMLPSQPVLRQFFKGDDEAFHASLEAVLLGVLPHPSVASRWDIELKPGVTYASLGSDLVTLNLYQFLIRLGGFRTVLELGTYIGVSTLFLAEAVGPEGRVTTVERGEEFHGIARRNFARNGMEDRIVPLLGDAVEVLHQQVEEGRSYDMVIVDAGKEDYADLLASALGCLAPGGVVVVDDVFMCGDSLNALPETDKGKGVRRMLTEAEAVIRANGGVILPVSNGLLLLRKPRP